MSRSLSPIYLDAAQADLLPPTLSRSRRKRIVFGWYGGKFNHLEWLLPLLPRDHHYCEPFSGSAAVLLNRLMPARVFVRALFYVPVVISGVASGIVFLRLFDPVIGIVNQLLSSVGLPIVDWQSSGTAALASVIIVSLWKSIGFGMVVYLAGLQGVPHELYEAATVDGALSWNRFRHITWPLLRPTTFFLVVYSIIESFQVFDVVYVLTGGGPGNATTFLVQYAYDQGFSQRRQGDAAAIGVILYVVVLAFTVVQWRVARGRDES